MAASYQLPELKAERLSVLVDLAPALCAEESPLLRDGMMREFLSFLSSAERKRNVLFAVYVAFRLV